MLKGVKWKLSYIRTKVIETISDAIGYKPLFINIQIEKMNLKDNDILVVEGEYSIFLRAGERYKFHIEYDHDTLNLIEINVKPVETLV